MSRYIDADALITDLNKGLWGKDWDKVLAEAIINEAPSIDIVRCKECKYFKHGVRFNKPRYTDIENFCAYHMVFDWNANAFCSYGVRLE